MTVIAVGSKNATKIKCLLKGHQAYHPNESYIAFAYTTVTILDETTQENITVLASNPKVVHTVGKNGEIVDEQTQFDNFVFGFEVESNVSNQPFSASETLTGARNRRNNVKKIVKDTISYIANCIANNITPPENVAPANSPLIATLLNKYNANNDQNITCYAAGVEGGIEQVDDIWLESGYISISRVTLKPSAASSSSNTEQKVLEEHDYDNDDIDCIGTSARFQLAQFVIDELKQGKELCEVADRLSNREDVRSTSGYMGLITNNLLDRTTAYVHGVIFAFSRFENDEKQYW